MHNHDYHRAEEEDLHHFIQCRSCGQWIDSRDLAEVLYHEAADHEAHKPPESIAAEPPWSSRLQLLEDPE
ncbi:hypothetical protein [Haloferula sp. BvORR071]|uniref:hypothetical protein n=1 Tax=Haloferula sp. BvORR071 TaxID=1396141 RepID=UPI0005538A1E|nr:hypothetical protein [Haloferula sp. BvORR071]